MACMTALKVYGVPVIKVTHEVNGVIGTESTGNIHFHQTDDAEPKIYFRFAVSPTAKANYELSQQFIDYCAITDHKFQMLVVPILNYQLEELGDLLEVNGLDLPDDFRDKSGAPRNPILVEDDENLFQLHSHEQRHTGTLNSGTNVSRDDTNVEAPMRPLSLRENIPALDESISAVRIAAAQSIAVPTLVMPQSQSSARPFQLGLSTSTDSREESGWHSSRPSAVGISSTMPSAPKTIIDLTGNALNFGHSNSALPEEVWGETPSRNSPTSSTQQPTGPRFNNNQRTSRMGAVPRSTMQEFYNQHIGVLGETFVNYWLVGLLGNDWDASHHWTSQNRNYVYADHPFTGNEGEFSDFTYPDITGRFTIVCKGFGMHFNVENWAASPPTYHLEVKSTAGLCSEPFYMSHNQVEMVAELRVRLVIWPKAERSQARGYSFSWDSDRVPEHVYMVIRVYNLEKDTPPQFAAYVDPWAMYLKKELSFLARDGYAVTPIVQQD